jgi:indole-3-glycerol phosphate synthase
MNFLEKILERKRAEVAERSAAVPLSELRARPDPRGQARPFAAALRASRGLALIAEIKKASPSAGTIRPDFDPAALAAAYDRGGASALSVLTDEPFFQGRLDYLRAARAAARLPCLRKDFIVSEYQVWEARAAGADAILLIVAALLRRELVALLDAARAAVLDVLVEVHDERELEAALQVDAPLIGINNRNLKTFKVDLAVTETLAPRVPRDRIVVSESGLGRAEHLRRVRDAGASAVLVGESLMRRADVEEATRELVAKMRD